jgi:hypothetical protein
MLNNTAQRNISYRLSRTYPGLNPLVFGWLVLCVYNVIFGAPLVQAIFAVLILHLLLAFLADRGDAVLGEAGLEIKGLWSVHLVYESIISAHLDEVPDRRGHLLRLVWDPPFFRRHANLKLRRRAFLPVNPVIPIPFFMKELRVFVVPELAESFVSEVNQRIHRPG